MKKNTVQNKILIKAKKFKNKIALHDIATGRDFSYKQLVILSYIISTKIKKLGELRVGLLLPNSAGCYATFLGALEASVTPVMINFSTGVIENCKHAKQKCGFDYIITSRKLLIKLKTETIPGMIFLEDWVKEVTTFDKIKNLFKFIFARGSLAETESEETAVILFTSGSEKEPKGVELSHKNLLANLKGIDGQFGFTEKEVFVSVLPVFHVFGLTTSFLLPLSLGCQVVVHPSPLDYEKIVKTVKKYKGTVFPATPTFFWGYLKKSEKGDFESLKHPIAGGDKLPKRVREGYLQEHGITVYEGYGCTETSPVISSNCEKYNRPGSIGKPLPGVKVKIINLETDEEVAVNQEGKILVKGDLVMKGYLDDLEETSLHIHAGWYDTGDMGLLDEDGFLWHKGRLKRFVKIAGEMVPLLAIENELEKHLPEEVLCCVVELPHPVRGAEIIAVITAEADRKILMSKLREKLPSLYLPKKIMVFKTLPLMGNGKVDFRLVTKLVQERLSRK